MVHRSTSELTLDGIVFNNRNRDYGAFQLREVYNLNLIKSLFIVLFTFSIALYVPKVMHMLFPSQDIGVSLVPISELPIDISKNYKIESPALPQAPSVIVPSTAPNLAPTIVKDDKVPLTIDLPKVPLDGGILNGPISNTPSSGSVVGAVVPAVPAAPLIEPAVTWAPTKQIFKPGNFTDFLGKKIHFPAQAQNMGISGKVYVEFIIEKDGTISNVKVAKSVDASLDEEALRVVRLSSGLWEPAKNNDIPVRIKIVQAIFFKLQENN